MISGGNSFPTNFFVQFFFPREKFVDSQKFEKIVQWDKVIPLQRYAKRSAGACGSPSCLVTVCFFCCCGEVWEENSVKARQRESLFEREHYLGCLTGERRESKMIHARMRLLFI